MGEEACNEVVSVQRKIRTLSGAGRGRIEPKVYHWARYENKNWRRPSVCFFALLGALAASAAPVGIGQSAQLSIGGAALEVSFDGRSSPEFRQLALDWITRSAKAVSTYYGRFPVRQAAIYIRVGRGHRVGPGNSSDEEGARIRVTLGSGVGQADLTQDGDSWLMTHEMVHLALPGVEESHHWLEEGLATYVEPIARARAGELAPERVWRDMVDGMPQGEPEEGDRGLDHTPTWGRTYWGGALYCLLADVGIRKATHNAKGLDDALRGSGGLRLEVRLGDLPSAIDRRPGRRHRTLKESITRSRGARIPWTWMLFGANWASK